MKKKRLISSALAILIFLATSVYPATTSATGSTETETVSFLPSSQADIANYIGAPLNPVPLTMEWQSNGSTTISCYPYATNYKTLSAPVILDASKPITITYDFTIDDHGLLGAGCVFTLFNGVNNMSMKLSSMLSGVLWDLSRQNYVAGTGQVSGTTITFTGSTVIDFSTLKTILQGDQNALDGFNNVYNETKKTMTFNAVGIGGAYGSHTNFRTLTISGTPVDNSAEVIDKINRLPAKNSLNIGNINTVSCAEKLYNALTEYQKEQIPNKAVLFSAIEGRNAVVAENSLTPSGTVYNLRPADEGDLAANWRDVSVSGFKVNSTFDSSSVTLSPVGGYPTIEKSFGTTKLDARQPIYLEYDFSLIGGDGGFTMGVSNGSNQVRLTNILTGVGVDTDLLPKYNPDYDVSYDSNGLVIGSSGGTWRFHGCLDITDSIYTFDHNINNAQKLIDFDNGTLTFDKVSLSPTWGASVKITTLKIYGTAAVEGQTAPSVTPDAVDYSKSVINEGNSYRVAAALKKAQNGQPITVGVVGGSITSGASAYPLNLAYGNLVTNWLQAQYPNTAITFVNAGIGGTNSIYGVSRATRDLLSKDPDLVIVEFSVNDYSAIYTQESYEGLIRKLLYAKNLPGIICLATVPPTGNNWQEVHNYIARNYNIPFLSFKDTYLKTIFSIPGKTGMSPKEIWADGVHPTNKGHEMLADLVIHYLNGVKQSLTPDQALDFTVPSAVTSNGYENAVLLESTTSQPVATNWTGISNDGYWSNGWMTSTIGSTLVFNNVKGGYITAFFQAKTSGGGKATVQVDSNAPVELNGDFSGGWGDYMAYTNVMHSADKDTLHTITVTFTSGSSFKLCSLSIANSATGTDTKGPSVSSFGVTETGVNNSDKTIQILALDQFDSVNWSTLKVYKDSILLNGAAVTESNGSYFFTATENGEYSFEVSDTLGNTGASNFVTVSNIIIAVTGVTLDKTTLTAYVGGIYQLNATVSPADAGNKNVTYDADNSCITVGSDGKVTAVSPGTAKVTVTTVDGSKTAFCTVTVKDPKITSGIYSVDDSKKRIEGISANTTVSTVISALTSADDVVAVDKDDISVSNTSVIGTGMKLIRTSENQSLYELTAVVTGDVTGDGNADVIDLIKVKNTMLGKDTLGGVYFAAGDLVKDSNLGILDLLSLKDIVIRNNQA